MPDDIETLRTHLADVMGEGGSYRTLQTNLDAALQKHKDDAESHQRQLTATLSEQEERHQRAIEQLRSDHRTTVAQLKTAVLGPALRDLQARQAADLAAKHAADLEALAKD